MGGEVSGGTAGRVFRVADVRRWRGWLGGSGLRGQG